MVNPVVHFEIMSSGGAELRRWYTETFQWDMTQSWQGPMDYGVVAAPDGRGIGGGIGKAEDRPNLVTVYIEVDDPQTYLNKIAESGGETVQPVTEIPGIVTFALFRDPEGNVVGLTKPWEEIVVTERPYQENISTAGNCGGCAGGCNSGCSGSCSHSRH